jgi:hypothetical protein
MPVTILHKEKLMSAIKVLLYGLELLTEIEAGEPFSKAFSIKECKQTVEVTVTGSLSPTPAEQANGILTQDVSRVTLISMLTLVMSAMAGGATELYHAYKLANNEYLNVQINVSVL